MQAIKSPSEGPNLRFLTASDNFLFTIFIIFKVFPTKVSKYKIQKNSSEPLRPSQPPHSWIFFKKTKNVLKHVFWNVVLKTFTPLHRFNAMHAHVK